MVTVLKAPLGERQVLGQETATAHQQIKWNLLALTKQPIPLDKEESKLFK